MDSDWLDLLFPGQFNVLSVLNKKDDEGREWPDFPDRAQCGNVIIYNLKGKIVGERLNSIRVHDSLVGQRIQDWFEHDSRIQSEWETAVDGKVGGWIGRLDGGTNIYVANLYPYSPMPHSRPIAVIGLITAIDEASLDWLADNGVPVVPHG